MKKNRFIACLCFPILEVLLHTIIDELRHGEDKIKYMMSNGAEGKWWKKKSHWITFARVGLPITYLVIAMAIFIPGIVNLVISAS